MLNQVRIRRFKTVEDATLTFGAVTVLVGPNNAGKSSALQAIQFAVSIAQSLQLAGARGWIKTANERSGSLSSQQLVYTPLSDVDRLAYGGALRQGANPISVSFKTDDLGSSQVTVTKGKNKNVQVKISGHRLGVQLEKLAQPYSVVAPGLAGIPSVEAFQSSGVVQRAAARGDANSVFRNVLLALSKDAAAWAQFKRSLSEVFPDVTIGVSFDDASDEYISVWAEREGGPRLPVESSGTGVLQAIQVLSYIGLYKPRLLILDEPDAHLHPDNQRKLAQLLIRIAEERKFQVLLSTHSRHMLDELGRRGAAIQWMSGGVPRDGDFDLVSALLELGALDAGDRLRQGQVKMVIVTEDSDTRTIRSMALSSGLADGDFDIWSYASSSQTSAAVLLAKFVNDHAPGTRVVVHRDRDYLTEDAALDFQASLRAVGAEAFLTKGTDIESHLLELEHLKLVYGDLSSDEIASLLNQATEAAKGRSLEVMINQRNLIDQRERQKEVKSPNPGAVAARCSEDFAADPVRYRHGKTTLRRFRNLVQERHGINREIAVPSRALAVDALRLPGEPG
ncbi:AAA family ATPase [Arthrobacter woluwensis]|uniref:AAA family ATPase n=1 Tax=Arthrobacter woluwensis TaxID=156980 RepID=UPI001AAFBFEE|nr:ATP-binding protein [Arthrobacter woluwensis]QTF71356.1 ATP-binding protein [Arthrobacter woluwensis]